MTAFGTLTFRLDPLAEPPPAARDERVALSLSIAFAAALHVAIGASLPHRRVPADADPIKMEVIEVTPPEPPPSQQDQESGEPREDPPAPTPAQPSRVQAPSAAAAQAAQALTRSDAADESLDLTDAIVTGSAASYGGGTTSSAGTSSKASSGRSSTGVDGGAHAGTPSAPRIASAGPDRSRKAGLVGGLDWSCPFPSEADANGIDFGVVTLTVRVGASAEVDSVAVVWDPGHGFGAAALRCAYSKRWQAALDRGGSPIASRLTLNVRFTR